MMRRTRVHGTGIAVAAGLSVVGLLVVALTATLHESADSPTPTVERQPTATATVQLARDHAAIVAAYPSAIDVVAAVSPAVVTVIDVPDDASGVIDVSKTTTGSGFIVDQSGHIVTNDHIVAGQKAFVVVYANGDTVRATLVGEEPKIDLALLKVKGKLPGIATLGDSGSLRPGQPVLALGSPLGSLTNSVTQGIVSALGRSVPKQGDVPRLTGMIQHDAAIDAGSAGGPLVDFSGQVIGVNTVAIQQNDSGEPAQGLFFAIPSNTVKQVVAKLIDDGGSS
jgi:S1-C subfamily serine protease